jgi:hypothetical protein
MATNKSIDDVREIMLETARIQFATLNAGIVFWGGWVESASKTAQAIGDQLSLVGREGSDTDKILGKITDLSRAYLRQITELPSAAVSRFNSDLKAAGGAKASRRRSARTKE